MRILALGLLGAFATMASIRPPRAIEHNASECQANDAYMRWILNHQRYNLQHNLSPGHWQTVGLTRADTNLIQPVKNDSLCNIAGVTINRDMHEPDSTVRAIYLVTEGRYYIAIDHKLMGGEFVTAFFLDSTLTKVITRFAM